ncbi:MAG: DUF3579 domain-containing protein [Nitrosomonadales bacterium]|nr:DUF3579 domain-containing protein [Nitrosomonadales bacterium]
MPFDTTEFVIQGITAGGEVFQPADWAERLCDSLARTGADGHKTYSSYIRPMMVEGVNSVVVRAALRQNAPETFGLIKRYIVENRLMVRTGRGVAYVETSGIFPPSGKERRDPKRNDW